MKHLPDGPWRLQWCKVSPQRSDLKAGSQVAYPGRGGQKWGTVVAAGRGWTLVLSRLQTPHRAYGVRLQYV